MSYDLITVGRVSMDLFARDIGADFPAITAFETGVGGSPVNIAIGASRLGLRAIAFTAVGADEVGRFVRRYLAAEGVLTDYIAAKDGRRTGMALVGVQPPDRFPLLFYRENPADIHLTLDEARALPLAQTRALLLSGTALSRGSARDVTLYLAEQARARQLTTFIDLDLRPDQWLHPLAYGLNLRRLLPLCDVIVGTEEEFYAALAPAPETALDQADLQRLLRDFAESSAATFDCETGRPRSHGLRRWASARSAGFPSRDCQHSGRGRWFCQRLDLWLGAGLGLGAGGALCQCLWRAGGYAAWLRPRFAVS